MFNEILCKININPLLLVMFPNFVESEALKVRFQRVSETLAFNEWSSAVEENNL